MDKIQQKIWANGYRPDKIADMILPRELKKTLQSLANDPVTPPLLFTGPAGIGKTTAAWALLKEKGADVLFINGSKDRNIEVLRNDILNFATTLSFSGERKYVLIDEADGLNPQSMQPALRSFMEEYSANVGFVMTANFPNKIIEPIRNSRCIQIRFEIPKNERIDLISEMSRRAVAILKQENATFDKSVIPDLVLKYFPDFRAVLNALQMRAKAGTIDATILDESAAPIKELVKLMKSRKYAEVHKWYLANTDIDFETIVRALYDIMRDIIKPETIPVALLLFRDALYKKSFVADIEILAMCFFSDFMGEVQFI